MSSIASSVGHDGKIVYLKNLFESLDIDDKGYIMSHILIDQLNENGLKITDKRLKNVSNQLNTLNGLRKDIELNEETFCKVVAPNSSLINKALTGKLTIPNFEDFTEKIENIYNKVKLNKDGHNATYIPELAKVDSKLFGISVCTIDGQQFSIGDTKEPFCVQSCSKPISYLMAVDENGFDKVHHCMGREPSGVEFNKAILKKVDGGRQIPHNPMINAGAIMSCSMIEIGKTKSDRFNKAMDIWKKLAGNTKIGYQHATFLSEQAEADRNMCLGFMMKEKKAFMSHIKTANDLLDVLDFYFQTCSIEYSCEQLSILAATLANGGVCPTTNERIFTAENVKNCLSLMNSCGMYDYSGEWAFRVGIPAKSGVGGGIFLVIPGKMGIATFSPRLDKNGNSVRGIDFATRLTNTFNFHQYDNNLPGISNKIDPTEKKGYNSQLSLMSLLFAAAEGDLCEIKRLRADNVDILMTDYDNRSALHLAASNGHFNIVKYIINFCKKYSYTEKIECLDRWNRTPLDDAKTGNHIECIKILKGVLFKITE